MGFGQAISICFNKYCCFSGRARRSEYWYWVLFTSLLNGVVEAVAKSSESGSLAALVSIVSLALFLPSLGVSVRRLHDTGRSGWWLFLGLIPVVGGIILLVWCCKDSQPGGNAYGDNPKGY